MRPTSTSSRSSSRLIRAGRLAGFHFNDSKYGDDDLDAGSIDPFRLFRVFNELVDASARGAAGFDPAYMLDQSHNVTDPIESLMVSAMETQRAYAQALSSTARRWPPRKRRTTSCCAHRILKAGFVTDVSPILAEARLRNGGAIDPIARLSRFELSQGQDEGAARGRRFVLGDRLREQRAQAARFGLPNPLQI